MPDKAHIMDDVFCPTCGEKAWDYVLVQWGVLPSSTYKIGEEVRWLRDDQGGIVPPFRLMEVEPRVRRWNCGAPQFQNLILFDIVTDWTAGEVQCPKCHAGFVGCVALVRDGVFRQVLALKDGDVDRILGSSRGKATIVIVREDGMYWSREDWFDKTLEYHPASG